MARDDAQLKIRLPEELRYRVTTASEANGRSINAEVVKRLEESFEAPSLGASTELLWKAVSNADEALIRLRERTSALDASYRSDRYVLAYWAEAIRAAAAGDTSELDAIIAREQDDPMLGGFTPPEPIVEAPPVPKTGLDNE